MTNNDTAWQARQSRPKVLFQAKVDLAFDDEDRTFIPKGTIFSVNYYEDTEGPRLHLETNEYGVLNVCAIDDVKKVFRDPEYFTKDITESQSLAAQHINAILDTLQDENMPTLRLASALHDQMVPLARVVQFLGAMSAVHQKEITQLKEEVAQLRAQMQMIEEEK